MTNRTSFMKRKLGSEPRLEFKNYYQNITLTQQSPHDSIGQSIVVKIQNLRVLILLHLNCPLEYQSIQTITDQLAANRLIQ